MLGKAPQRRVCSSRLHQGGLPQALPSSHPWEPREPQPVCTPMPPHCGHATASSPRLGHSLRPANKGGERRQEVSRIAQCCSQAHDAQGRKESPI